MTADRRITAGETAGKIAASRQQSIRKLAMTSDRRAAEEALADYNAEGGTPLEQLKQELDRRAALVERVAKSLWSLQYLGPYETDANSSAKIEFRTIAKALIDLIRAETLEEAAVELERRGFKGLAKVAIRALKEKTND